MAQKRKKNQNFVHIGSILENIMDGSRGDFDIRLTRIWDMWDGIVDPHIAENARPVAFKGKLLIVHASSSSWINHLQYLKMDIISQINNALGKRLVNDIKFKIGSF